MFQPRLSFETEFRLIASPGKLGFDKPFFLDFKMNYISKKIAKIRTQGVLRTLEVQFNNFVPPWVFRYSMGDIYDLDIERLASAAVDAPPKDLIVRSLDSDADGDERMRLRAFTWNSVPQDTTADDIGYAVYDAKEPSKLLGGVWVARESLLENNLGLKFTFTDEQAWLYCAYVDPTAQGRGVYKTLISSVADDVKKRRFLKLLCIVQPWNKISRRIHQKRSSGITGRVSSIRVGPFAWISHSGNVEVDRRLVTAPAKQPAIVAISNKLWKRGQQPAVSHC